MGNRAKHVFVSALDLLTQLHEQSTENVHSYKGFVILRLRAPEVVLT